MEEKRLVLSKLCLSIKTKIIDIPTELDISHLNLINDILRDSNFDETKWSKLGSSLSLHRNKTKAIRERYSDQHECLLECLTLWLESQDALPHFLVAALKDNNETTAAEDIHKISMSKYQSLRIIYSKFKF